MQVASIQNNNSFKGTKFRDVFRVGRLLKANGDFDSFKRALPKIKDNSGDVLLTIGSTEWEIYIGKIVGANRLYFKVDPKNPIRRAIEWLLYTDFYASRTPSITSIKLGGNVKESDFIDAANLAIADFKHQRNPRNIMPHSLIS